MEPRARKGFRATGGVPGPRSSGSRREGRSRSGGALRWLAFFVLLGLFARVMRYALRFPLWDDESFLCVNFIGRSYAELLRPLDFHQVAPILFLWIERTVVRIFGFSELALRLVPFACSIASVLLFRRTASRLLSGLGLLLAVAIFAVSYPGIRYAAEAKQYGTDLFVSLGLMYLTVEWLVPPREPLALVVGRFDTSGDRSFVSGCLCGRRIQPGARRVPVAKARNAVRMDCLVSVERGTYCRIWFLFLAERPRTGGG